LEKYNVLSCYCFSANAGCKAAIKMLFDSGAFIDATDAVSKMVLKEQLILLTVYI